MTKSVKVSCFKSCTSDADARAAAPMSPTAAFLKLLMFGVMELNAQLSCVVGKGRSEATDKWVELNNLLL